MTSVLMNCSVPGVLGGDKLRPSFQCVITAPLSQKARCQTGAAVGHITGGNDCSFPITVLCQGSVSNSLLSKEQPGNLEILHSGFGMSSSLPFYHLSLHTGHDPSWLHLLVPILVGSPIFHISLYQVAELPSTRIGLSLFWNLQVILASDVEMRLSQQPSPSTNSWPPSKSAQRYKNLRQKYRSLLN